MPPAAAKPQFPPGGAPVSVLIDFDGTISLLDVGDELLARHAPDQSEVARMDALYDDGRVGSRELMRWDMDVLPDDAELLRREALSIPFDGTLAQLVHVVRKHGAAIEVVSDGLGFHVEPLLVAAGFLDIPVATNSNPLSGRGAGLSFPFGHPACFVCGTCKRERVRVHRAADRTVVFVGDGQSDRYAAHHADVVFAKGKLAAIGRADGLPFEPWDRLADVARWLDKAFADGRLPARGEDADSTTHRRPGEPRGFICGPEVWGPGRTTPERLPART